MNAIWLRKLLSVGTGPGIVIGEKSLEVVLARVRPAGIEVVGVMTVEGYRERPAAEWGLEYQDFLKKHSATHKSAVAVLPRHETIVRTMQMPGVNNEDATAAIRFQLESLHPFGDEEVVFDWVRVGKSSTLVVVIALRAVIDRYTALFMEAGIKLAGYGFSGGVIYPALRILNQPPAGGFVAKVSLDEAPGVEFYGESEARPLFSADFDLSPEHAVGLASAELRLQGEVAASPLAELLPPLKHTPDGFQKELHALSVCAAIDAACPHLAPMPNLLPPEMRTVSSRAIYIPSIALAAILALAGGALLLEGRYLDSQYIERLEAETKRLQSKAMRTQQMDKDTAALAARIRLLDEYRRRPRRDLDTLLELNKLLPAPAWVLQLQMSQSEIQLQGEIERSEDLLKKFDNSPFFAQTQFTTPINRLPTGELFRLKTQREEAAK